MTRRARQNLPYREIEEIDRRRTDLQESPPLSGDEVEKLMEWFRKIKQSYFQK